MRTKSTDLRCEVTGVARRTRRLWTSRRNKVLSGSRSTFRKLVCHSKPAGASICQALETHESALG